MALSHNPVIDPLVSRLLRLEVGWIKVRRHNQGPSAFGAGIDHLKHLLLPETARALYAQIVNHHQFRLFDVSQNLALVSKIGLDAAQQLGQAGRQHENPPVDESVGDAVGRIALPHADIAVKQQSHVSFAHFLPVFHIPPANAHLPGIVSFVVFKCPRLADRVSNAAPPHFPDAPLHIQAPQLLLFLFIGLLFAAAGHRNLFQLSARKRNKRLLAVSAFPADQ